MSAWSRLRPAAGRRRADVHRWTDDGGLVAAILISVLAVLARSIRRLPSPREPAERERPQRLRTDSDVGAVSPKASALAPAEIEAVSADAPARWPQRLAPDLVFFVVCAVVAAWRFAVLSDGGAPPGVDSGNWLALGHDLIGDRLRSPTIVYPPLVPLLVTGAVEALGLVNGVCAVLVASSLLGGVAVHVVLRHCGLRWAATALGALLVAGSATGEAAAWGGAPQLTSLGLLVFLLWSLDRFLREHRLRSAAMAGVLMAALLATSHLVSFAAVLCAGVLVATHLVVERPWRPAGFARLLGGGALVLVPCLPLAPLYAKLTGGLDAAPVSDDALVLVGGGNLVANVDFLFRDFAVLWRLALTAAVAMPFLLVHRRRRPAWTIATSVLAGSGLAVLLTRQSRFLYLLPVAIVLALGVWAEEARTLRLTTPRRARLAAAAVSVAVTAQVVLGLNFFTLQRNYYAVLDRGLLAGIDWVKTATPPGASVAVTTGRNDHLLGWWVEGLGDRRTLFASRLVWLNFDDERDRARTANALFAEGFPRGAALTSARRDGIDYVLIAKSGSAFDSGRLAAYRSRNPGGVAYENRSVVVLRLD